MMAVLIRVLGPHRDCEGEGIGCKLTQGFAGGWRSVGTKPAPTEPDTAITHRRRRTPVGRAVGWPDVCLLMRADPLVPGSCFLRRSSRSRSQPGFFHLDRHAGLSAAGNPGRTADA